MDYTLTHLTPNVIYAQLHRYPSEAESQRFLREFRQKIVTAQEKVYFIVDFRKGMFTNIKMIQEAAKLSDHPMFGASIGFGGNIIKAVFGDVFAENAKQDVPKDMFQTREQAVAELERLSPNALDGINWQSVIPS